MMMIKAHSHLHRQYKTHDIELWISTGDNTFTQTDKWQMFLKCANFAYRTESNRKLVCSIFEIIVIREPVGQKTKCYNASISVQTLIFHLVVNSTRLKTVRSGRWCCPNYTMAPRLVKTLLKWRTWKWWKSSFVIFLFFLLLSFFLSFFSQPSALTRAVPRTKRPRIAVKYLEDVPFESF